MDYQIAHKRCKKNKNLEKYAKSVFEGIALGRKKALEDWFRDKWFQLEMVKNLIIAEGSNEFNEILSEVKQNCNEYIELFIVSPQEKVIASSFKEHINLDFLKLANFQDIIQGKRYMYGPYCDLNTLAVIPDDKLFKDEVTLLFLEPFKMGEALYVLCGRVLNDDLSNVIQEEDVHIYKESGDNYLFMIANNRGIAPGTAISRSRFEDRTFTLGENLKDGITTGLGSTLKIDKHTEFEIVFKNPVTNDLHDGIKNTIEQGSSCNAWPGYLDYRHILVGGYGLTIIPPYSDEVWGMMCEGNILEIYNFESISKKIPIYTSGYICLSILISGLVSIYFPPLIFVTAIIFTILTFAFTHNLLRYYQFPLQSHLLPACGKSISG